MDIIGEAEEPNNNFQRRFIPPICHRYQEKSVESVLLVRSFGSCRATSIMGHPLKPPLEDSSCSWTRFFRESMPELAMP